jgi:hypothetical protein
MKRAGLPIPESLGREVIAKGYRSSERVSVAERWRILAPVQK